MDTHGKRWFSTAPQASTELSQRFDFHPNHITQWTTLLLERAAAVFEEVESPQAPVVVNRKHVVTLMRRRALKALYQKLRTIQRHPMHKVYPYLLRHLHITCPNQVWAMDITYIAECWPGACRAPWLCRSALTSLRRPSVGMENPAS